jgi:4-amino-4-deoxy-L-arabinose transferase-like glycosyltransferase
MSGQELKTQGTLKPSEPREVSEALPQRTKEQWSIVTYVYAERFPLMVVLTFFALACLLVSPLQNVGVIDDWTYAWSVEHFLKTGHLAVLDWSAHYPIFQTLWGSLFALPFGISFGVLRVSTIILAVVGCMAFYLTLRELEFDRWRSSLGTFVLASNPVFFVLSFSFMTDVPFIAMTNLALLCYVVGVKRERYSFLWLGGLFAVAAFLSRQVGVAIPVALAPCLLQRDVNWRKFTGRLLPVAATLAFIGLLWWLEWHVLGRTSVMEKKTEGLQWWFTISFKSYLKHTIQPILQVAFYASPLLIAAVSLKPRWWLLVVAAVAIVSAILLHLGFGEVMYPLDEHGTWNTDELGDARGLMPGAWDGRGPMPRLTEPLRWLMLISWGVLVTGLARFVFKRDWRTNAGKRFRDAISSPATILIVFAILQIAIILALWFYYDRYYLVLLPTMIYLSLKASQRTGLLKPLAILGIALLATVSVAGTWDMLHFDQFCWDTYKELRISGVPPRDIDAGYVINGWMLYAHPENLRPGADPKKNVPYITGDEDLPYKISMSPGDDSDYQTVKETSLHMPFWSISNKLYVVHKRAVPASEDASK